LQRRLFVAGWFAQLRGGQNTAQPRRLAEDNGFMLPELEAKGTGQNQGRNRLNAVSSVDCESGWKSTTVAGAKELHRGVTERPERHAIPTSTSSRSRHGSNFAALFSERLNSRASPDIRALALANDSSSDRASHRSRIRSTRLDRRQSTYSVGKTRKLCRLEFLRESIWIDNARLILHVVQPRVSREEITRMW